VILTYYDVDNDCVTIASTEELLDAIDQFSVLQKPVLRITTDVKKKEGASTQQTQTTPSRASTSTSTASNTNNPEDKDPTIRPSVPLNGRTNQLQNLVESFVSIVATAVVALQTQVAEVNPNTSTAAPVSESETAEKLAKEVVGNIEMNRVDEAPKQDDAVKTEAKDPEVRPFIHGRHTCDGCLCTPIIDIRYHSTNLPDYDLCAKCRDNYKGTANQFEPAELERDRPFQERWHRKRARFAQRGGACRPNVPGPCGPRSGPPFRGPHGRRRGGKFRWQQGGMEGAMKEAIRRSLQDVKVKPVPEPSAPTEAPVPVADAEEVAPSTGESSADVTNVTESTSSPDETTPVQDDTVVEIAVEAPVAPSDEPTTETVKDTSFSSDAVGHGDAAERLGHTLDECAEAINAMVSELDREQAVAVDESVSDDEVNYVYFDTDDEGNAVGFDTYDESTAINQVTAVESDNDDEGAAVDEVIDTEFDNDDAVTAIDEVIAAEFDNDDAVATIDQVIAAEFDNNDEVAAVDQVTVVEVDNDDVAAIDQVIAVEVDTDEDELPTLLAITSEQDAIAGEKIVDGEEVNEGADGDDDKKSESSEEEWEVVGEDQQIAGDEMIARAAQLIGSALFQSDLRSSEGGSTLTNSGNFGERSECLSVPSSVPSMTSEISCAVLDRWALQLSQLHELGFHDDKKTVDILEHLTAANIGVDSNDEVSVTQVVNALLKQE